MQRTFKLWDLIVLIIIIAVMLVLVVVLVQRSRESSRRMMCQNNLKQLGLATHTFYDAQKHLPKANYQPQFCREQFFNEETGGYGNRELYGVLPVLIPYIESTPYYEILMTQLMKEGDAPAPWDDVWSGPSGTPTGGKYSGYPPISQPFSPVFLCPNDPMSQNLQKGDFGRTNYNGCRGDIWVNWKSPSTRGAFVSGANPPIGLGDLLKGISATLLFAECVIGNNHGGRNAPVRGGMAYGMPFGADAVPMRCLERAGQDGKLTGDQNHDVLTDMRGSGLCWLSGRQAGSQFFAILPPNSPSCSSPETDWPDWAFNSAGSYHAGGCYIAMADGSVNFVSNDIDCGDLNQPLLDELKKIYPNLTTAESASYIRDFVTWGIWGSMGNRFIGPTNDGIP